ncbi:hypothetical protein ACFLVR_05505 [Chloroflexota bacterium]
MKPETSQGIQQEISTLNSTLEDAVSHLAKIDNHLRREVRMVSKMAAHVPEFNGELISNVTGFGSVFTKQFEEVRIVIETTKALSFLINDYTHCLKGEV